MSQDLRRHRRASSPATTPSTTVVVRYPAKRFSLGGEFFKVRTATAERRRATADIIVMHKMRETGASFTEIGAAFGLHHSTVMHHLDGLDHIDLPPVPPPPSAA